MKRCATKVVIKPCPLKKYEVNIDKKIPANIKIKIQRYFLKKTTGRLNTFLNKTKPTPAHIIVKTNMMSLFRNATMGLMFQKESIKIQEISKYVNLDILMTLEFKPNLIRFLSET